MVEELAVLLRSEGEAGGIHYMSFFVIRTEGELPTHVVLEVRCDGSARGVRKRLVQAERFMRELFSGCTGFPEEAERWSRYLDANTVPADSVYVAFPGRSLRQIRDEHELRLDVRQAYAGPAPAALTGRCPVRASQNARSLRLSPTSASAPWRLLREQFAGDPRVRRSEERPFLVRWSLNDGIWRDRLNLWAKRLGCALLVLGALWGLWLLAAGALGGVGPTLLALAAALALPASVFVLTVLWLEGPRALRWRGQLRILGGALWQLVVTNGLVALLLGMAVLVASVATRLSLGVSVASTLALLAACAALAKAKLSQTAVFTGALVLFVAGLLPTDQLIGIPYGVVVVLSLVLLVLLTAFLYVMLGRLAALIGLAVLAGAAVGCGWFIQQQASVMLRLMLSAGFFAGVSVVSIGLAALWLARCFYAVRRLEQAEATATTNRPAVVKWDVGHLNGIQSQEDTGLQNHLATLSRLKPGPLRLQTLRRVLRFVNLVARVQGNRGDLGGIVTIHFASFLILPDAQHLLFLGNYDGGFGSYLHEFNSVSQVTAVWSNCLGFPRSFFLAGDGASDEQRFKAFARQCQVQTLGWYSAYPELSIRDIEAATLTREDLRRPLENPSTWFGRMQARFGLPLSEADCDLCLRRL